MRKQFAPIVGGKGHPASETRNKYQRQKDYSHQFTVRISHEDKELLWERARRKKLSVAELIRIYIEWGLENGNADRVI